MNFLKLMIYGLVIGVANIIPGVSGGTMAVVLGIYDQLLAAISFKNLKKNILFLLPIGIGAGLGILLLSRAIKFLILNYAMCTNFAFIGLILGSVPMIWTRLKNSAPDGKLHPWGALWILPTFALMILFMVLDNGAIENAAVTALTPAFTVKLTLASAVSAFAMILPGVSGSFVMLLLGTYTTVITAISDFNVIMLIPVAAGCGLGLLFGAMFISKLIKRFPQQTYAAIMGLILGSLFNIFPGFTFDLQGIISLLLMAAFGYLSWWFSRREDS